MNLAVNYMGLKLANPIIPGASPFSTNLDQVRRLEDAGAAAIVMHSLFEEQIVQETVAHLPPCRVLDPRFSEAVSFFPRPSAFPLGPQEYLEQLRRVKEAVHVPVIASLNGAHPGSWIEYSRLLEQAGARALELNVYFLPSEPDCSGLEVEHRLFEIVREVRDTVQIPIAVKLSPFYSSLPHVVEQLRGLGVNSVVLFSRFSQPEIDIEQLETRPALELSDSSELLLRLRWTAMLTKRIKLPIVVSGGVHTYSDVVKAIMTGATAVQTVSALLKNGPDYLGVLVRELREFMDEQDYSSIERFQGCLSLKYCPNPEAFERTNYLRTLQLRP